MIPLKSPASFSKASNLQAKFADTTLQDRSIASYMMVGKKIRHSLANLYHALRSSHVFTEERAYIICPHDSPCF